MVTTAKDRAREVTRRLPTEIPKNPTGGILGQLPTDRLKSEAQNLLGAARERALASAKEKVGGAAERLTSYVEQGGGPGLMAAVTGAKNLSEGKSPARALLGAGMAGAKGKLGSLLRGKGKGKGGKGQKIKVTNIIESVDVGVPVHVAYDQWTQFRDFPTFMKKVENVEQEADEKLGWRAQIFWSHRNWQSTILQQVPDQRIVWRSTGNKGYVDGAVTFHELAPELTRILLVLEYHPKGFFEQTGNLWRAQGRRARLELKHFGRHVMTQTILRPDEIEGWRGVIEDGKVVKDHESAVREEQQRGGEEPARGGLDEDLPGDGGGRAVAGEAGGEYEEEPETGGEYEGRAREEEEEAEAGYEAEGEEEAEPAEPEAEYEEEEEAEAGEAEAGEEDQEPVREPTARRASRTPHGDGHGARPVRRRGDAERQPRRPAAAQRRARA